MNEAPSSVYKCSGCSWESSEKLFEVKILSIMYRPKTDTIQSFKQIKCPKCHSLVNIIFENLACGGK